MQRDERPAADERPREECDLVMKGGITSGVVYPAAISNLCKRYRLRSVGGTSAGAIAAAAAAAAEYGRDEGGFEHLASLSRELSAEGLIESLFQPARPVRPFFALFLELQRRRGQVWGRVRAGVAWAARTFGAVALVTAVVTSALLAFVVDGPGVAWPEWVVLGVMVVVSVVVAVVVALVLRVLRVVLRELPANLFGVATGMPEPGRTEPALTPWLHERIQSCAGRPGGPVLTFADLRAKGITLQMMTTDLAEARPVRLPLEDSGEPGRAVGYLYDPDELSKLFPADVIERLERASEAQPAPENPRLRTLPASDLPVVVATRMSLSFPVLLSAVPVWTVRDGAAVRHWLSDGGIGSNFPIHLFDSWLPTRPTFGLNFVPERRAAGAPEERRGPRLAARPRATIDGSAVAFARQILDTMQNWRDTMQAELEGFNDRIYDVRLGAGQGGMNLTMDEAAVSDLVRKGEAAGTWLVEEFEFTPHKMRRYRLFMHLLQHAMKGTQPGDPSLSKAFDDAFEEVVRATLPREWGELAARETRSLVEAARNWGPGGRGSVDFAMSPPPQPKPVMRVTPDV